MLRDPEVLVYGDINIDVLVFTDVIPKGDVSLLAKNIRITCGGVGSNLSSALTKLGIKTSLIGAVGKDVLGTLALKRLKKKGIDVSLVQTLKNVPTGLMIIFINSQGIRSIIGYRGANAEVQINEKCLTTLDYVKHLHVSGYTFLNKDGGQGSLKLLIKAKKNRITTSVDLEGIALHKSSLASKIAGLTDYVMLNKEELLHLTNSKSLSDEAIALAFKMIKPKILAIKLGKDGSLIVTKNKKINVKPFKVKVIDSTGAGDGFNAGFLYGMLKGLTIEESAILGNALGAYVCSGLGAQHHPSIKQLLRKFPQLKSFIKVTY